MKNFLTKTENVCSLISSIIPTVLLWIFQPKTPVPYFVFVIAVLFLWMFMWLTLKFYIENKDLKNKTFDMELHILNCRDKKIILCYPCSNASLNSIVTVYKLENQYENILAYGYVRNIQGNGYIEVEIIKFLKKEFRANNFENYINSNSNNIIIKNIATMEALYTLTGKSERS